MTCVWSVGPFARTSIVVEVVNECDSKTRANTQDKQKRVVGGSGVLRVCVVGLYGKSIHNGIR